MRRRPKCAGMAASVTDRASIGAVLPLNVATTQQEELNVRVTRAEDQIPVWLDVAVDTALAPDTAGIAQHEAFPRRVPRAGRDGHGRGRGSAVSGHHRRSARRRGGRSSHGRSCTDDGRRHATAVPAPRRPKGLGTNASGGRARSRMFVRRRDDAAGIDIPCEHATSRIRPGLRPSGARQGTLMCLTGPSRAGPAETGARSTGT